MMARRGVSCINVSIMLSCRIQVNKKIDRLDGVSCCQPPSGGGGPFGHLIGRMRVASHKTRTDEGLSYSNGRFCFISH